MSDIYSQHHLGQGIKHVKLFALSITELYNNLIIISNIIYNICSQIWHEFYYNWFSCDTNLDFLLSVVLSLSRSCDN